MKKIRKSYDISYEEWKEKYKPLPESFEADDIRNIKPNPLTVWTYGSGDFGGRYIWSDWRTMGRICYYITEIPHKENEFIQVTVEEAPDVCVNFWTKENLGGKLDDNDE